MPPLPKGKHIKSNEREIKDLKRSIEKQNKILKHSLKQISQLQEEIRILEYFITEHTKETMEKVQAINIDGKPDALESTSSDYNNNYDQNHFNPPKLNAIVVGANAFYKLVISFELDGLSKFINTSVTVSAFATIIYGCINKKGGFPVDSKKYVVSQPISTSVLVNSGIKGKITKFITLAPPSLTLECPPEQSIVPISVSYANIQVTEPFTGTISIPGTFDREFLHFN